MYSPPNKYGFQYLLLCEFYCGKTIVLGERDEHNFGYDVEGQRVFTAQDPDHTVLIATNPMQVVPRYVMCIVDRLAFYNNISPTDLTAGNLSQSSGARPRHDLVMAILTARHWNLLFEGGLCKEADSVYYARGRKIWALAGQIRWGLKTSR